MKIGGRIIQNRNIKENTPNDFWATYKGKEIFISTDHGHGEPEFEHLKRFDMDVQDIESGMLDVSTYEDHHSIRDAILSALEGACL